MSTGAPTTAREALLAELLGDVGLLHDKLELLKTDLPQLTHVYVVELEKATLSVSTSVAELSKLAQATRDLSGQLSAQVEGLATLEPGQMTTEKMRVHTQTYLDALSREVSKMAANEVSRQFRKLSNSPVQLLTIGGVVILLLIEISRLIAK